MRSTSKVQSHRMLASNEQTTTVLFNDHVRLTPIFLHHAQKKVQNKTCIRRVERLTSMLLNKAARESSSVRKAIWFMWEIRLDIEMRSNETRWPTSKPHTSRKYKFFDWRSWFAIKASSARVTVQLMLDFIAKIFRYVRFESIVFERPWVGSSSIGLCFFRRSGEIVIDRKALLTVESFSISSSEAPRDANPISCENWAKEASPRSGMCPSNSWMQSLER